VHLSLECLMRLLCLVVSCALIISSAPLAFAQVSSKQIVGGANPSLPFSTAVKAGGFVYVSGAIVASPGADIRKQTRDTLDSIAATLKSAGSSLTNAASVTVYLTKVEDFAAMNDVYATFFPSDPPARTTVVVTQPLANAAGLVEISAIGIPTGAERRVVLPAGWMKPTAPYSYAIKSGSTLFLAGLVSRNPRDNAFVNGDLGAQTKVAMESASSILKEAGMTFADVVASRVWYTEPSNQAMNDVYRTYWDGVAPPVRAAVRTNLTSPDYLVEVTMTAVKDPSRKAIIPPNADGTPGRPGGVLSPAIQVRDRLYIAGMVGSTPTNKGDAKAQTAEALARIERALKAAGYDWSNIVDALVYLPDMSKFQDMNAAYREAITKDFPARATIGAGLGGDALVEIMFTAVK
jgi:2-iminobutanoate/2-iminopropanoate deaminase